MKVALKKWGWRLLRVAVIAAALFYVIWNVHWHDFATLADGKTTVRAYGQSEDGTRILADFDNDGTPEEHAAKEFSRPKSKDPKQVLPIVVPGLRTVLHETRWGYVVVALAIFAPNYVFMAWRLRLLLRTQGVYLRRRDAVKVSYASAFLNFAVPTGSTGGDIYKAWYVAAHATGRRTEAVTVVLLDRAIGLINFIIMAAIVSLLSWMSGRVGVLGGFVATAFTVSILAGCAFFSQRVRKLIRIDSWLPKLKFGDHLVRIDRTAFSLRGHPDTLARAFMWTIIVQTVVCVDAMILARGVGMQVDLVFGHVLDFFLAVIVGLTVSALPGNPPQGFGVLEGIMAHILTPHYGDWPHIFAVCMGVRLLHLAWSLPGALVLLIEPRPKPPTTEEAPASDHPAVVDAVATTEA
ncbi:MAG: flippase-like domain-containing protein [Phycisphaerae bacterium]|nr:flippase-like domain-containing protein [Phycisphaerae bacterium]NUQ47678.1 flippase-like domain-containing protein [Phycisphaerae bacterium]